MEAVEQGTTEWLQQRCGKITASCFGLVMAKPKSKGKDWTQAADTYANEIVAERLMGRWLDRGSSRATDWGHEHEPDAINRFADTCDANVTPAPFIMSLELDDVGGSPDAFVGDDGLLEVKCPYNPGVHVATVRSGEMPPQHKAQVQGNLWITGRECGWFVSYRPDMPACSLFSRRIPRDEEYIQTLSERVDAFSEYVKEIERQLRG